MFATKLLIRLALLLIAACCVYSVFDLLGWVPTKSVGTPSPIAWSRGNTHLRLPQFGGMGLPLDDRPLPR